MECSITKLGDNIMVTKTFDNYEDRGEIAHFIVELELLKKELLKIFNDLGSDIKEK